MQFCAIDSRASQDLLERCLCRPTFRRRKNGYLQLTLAPPSLGPQGIFVLVTCRTVVWYRGEGSTEDNSLASRQFTCIRPWRRIVHFPITMSGTKCSVYLLDYASRCAFQPTMIRISGSEYDSLPIHVTCSCAWRTTPEFTTSISVGNCSVYAQDWYGNRAFERLMVRVHPGVSKIMVESGTDFGKA
jgi:hypothetical protein